jgi:branched-chain amino acid transport system substrate-binding protein
MRRVRGLSACIFGALVTVLAGCASPANTGTNISGSTLTIYASQPPGGAGGQKAQDIIAAERLALNQAASRVGPYKIKFVVLKGKTLSGDARTAIQDQSAIAYLGDLVPGTSDRSLGITNGVNGQPLLQVSPTDDAVELTQTSPAVRNSPTTYYEALSTNGRTFGRVVPVNTHEATALVKQMKKAGVKRLYVTHDGGDYGKAIAFAVTQAAGQQGIAVVTGRNPAAAKDVAASRADAVFFGTNAEAQAASLFNGVASVSSKVRLFGPSALDDNTFAAGLVPAAQSNTVVAAPGFLSRRMLSAPAGPKFLADFKTATGHDAGPGGGVAIFGYDAMQLVLDVLRRAGATAGNHKAVVNEFHNTKSRASVLGTYNIDASGDTSLSPTYVLRRIKTGKFVPFASEQG